MNNMMTGFGMPSTAAQPANQLGQPSFQQPQMGFAQPALYQPLQNPFAPQGGQGLQGMSGQLGGALSGQLNGPVDPAIQAQRNALQAQGQYPFAMQPQAAQRAIGPSQPVMQAGTGALSGLFSGLGGLGVSSPLGGNSNFGPGSLGNPRFNPPAFSYEPVGGSFNPQINSNPFAQQQMGINPFAQRARY